MPSMPFRLSHRLLARTALAACLVVTAIASGARAETTTYQPAAPQPTLPTSGVPKSGSPSLSDDQTLEVHVRKGAEHVRRHQARGRSHHLVRYRTTPPIERPALAGVELLQPLPRPDEPPHIVVPLPAYVLDPVFLPFTTPPPPVVCHPTRRDPDLPDPRLYRERTVVCEADNP